MKKISLLLAIMCFIAIPALGIMEANPILVWQWWEAPVDVIIDARDRLNRAIVDKGGEAITTTTPQNGSVNSSASSGSQTISSPKTEKITTTTTQNKNAEEVYNMIISDVCNVLIELVKENTDIFPDAENPYIALLWYYKNEEKGLYYLKTMLHRFLQSY